MHRTTQGYVSVPSAIASTLVTAWAPQLAPIVVAVEFGLVSFLANPTTATVAASVLAVLVSLMFLPAIPIGFTARNLCLSWCNLYRLRVLGATQSYSAGSMLVSCPHGVIGLAGIMSVPWLSKEFFSNQLTLLVVSCIMP